MKNASNIPEKLPREAIMKMGLLERWTYSVQNAERATRAYRSTTKEAVVCPSKETLRGLEQLHFTTRKHSNVA